MANTPNDIGRPPEEFDLEQVELFGRFKATYETMADWFDVSTRTIERLMSPSNPEMTDFCRHYKKGNSDLKLRLSEAQIHNAIVEGNATLQVWLGKQYLNQKDKQEIESNVNANISNTDELKEMETEDILAIKAIHDKYKKEE